eukprot:GHVQ01038702.1.p2 GENE.GHVQ01038702.1~~GHVQ01038702.1.p2  ORF type:complete len:221 (-),score=39.59 GHVQ01038702.1:1845-2507(-)
MGVSLFLHQLLYFLLRNTVYFLLHLLGLCLLPKGFGLAEKRLRTARSVVVEFVDLSDPLREVCLEPKLPSVCVGAAAEPEKSGMQRTDAVVSDVPAGVLQKYNAGTLFGSLYTSSIDELYGLAGSLYPAHGGSKRSLENAAIVRMVTDVLMSRSTPNDRRVQFATSASQEDELTGEGNFESGLEAGMEAGQLPESPADDPQSSQPIMAEELVEIDERASA